MHPNDFYPRIVSPALHSIEMAVGIPATDEARVLLMTIAGQESNWMHRRQLPVAYARSYWQFEEGGGVYGVLTHAASAEKIKTICAALDIPCDVETVHEAMAWNDMLACSMARLLLYTDPPALPSVGDKQGSWDTYIRCWRPGAPHPDTWSGLYDQALAAMAGTQLA